MKDLGWKPYKPHYVQQWIPDDCGKRMGFCEHFLQWTDDCLNVLNNIIWSDQAVFHVGGFVNFFFYFEHLEKEFPQIKSKG